MRVLGLRLLALYPQAWRARYEPEMRALLEERPVTAATLADVLRGAADAHLHAGGLEVAPLERMRNTVAATLCCWIAFVIAGAGFAKLTEDAPFRAAGHAHVLLGATRLAVEALALLSAAAILIGGAPLILVVLHQAWRERPRALVRPVCAPIVAIATAVAATAVLAWLAGSGHLHAQTAAARSAFVTWVVVLLAAAAVCALGSRAALRAARLAAAELRVAVRGAALVALAMAALTLAVALYCVALAIDAPALAASANGPLAASTTASLGCAAAAMAALSALATVTTRRGLRALRGR